MMWATTILPTSISLRKPPLRELSFSLSIAPDLSKFASFIPSSPRSRPDFSIRMGGGPRTFPGGVSKWQWKRMQAKKAKQLMKARLSRERHLYEMRKRAELKAAVAELEKPWEAVEKAPTLFSVSADEQLKVLADRFQKPGGFDMWSDNDGPRLFQTSDKLPSARFSPKDTVLSKKPHGPDDGNSESDVASDFSDGEEVPENRTRTGRRGKNRRSRVSSSHHFANGDRNDDADGTNIGVKSFLTKSSEPSASSLRGRKESRNGRRKWNSMKGNNPKGGFPKTNGRRQQHHVYHRNGSTSELKRSQEEQVKDFFQRKEQVKDD